MLTNKTTSWDNVLEGISITFVRLKMNSQNFLNLKFNLLENGKRTMKNRTENWDCFLAVLEEGKWGRGNGGVGWERGKSYGLANIILLLLYINTPQYVIQQTKAN